MTSFQLPDSTRVAQVHLRVRDMQRAIAFYTRTVGLQVIKSAETDVSLSATGQPPALLVLTEDRLAPLKPGRSTGLYHTAFRFPSRQDLAHALRRVSESGYAIDGASDHIFSEAIYLDDPEGNGVELYVDRPHSKWPPLGETVAMPPPRPLDLRELLSTIKSDPDQPLAPPNTDIGHIHLHVADLELADEFFHGFIGLEKMIRGPGALFFSAGGYHHHIGTNTWAGATPAPEGSTGLVSYRLEVPIREVLYCLRLRAPISGYATQSALTETGGELLRISDPNNVWLEMYATQPDDRTPASEATAVSTLSRHSAEHSTR